MSTYLVKVRIYAGEYEKTSLKLISADSFSLAIHYGIYAESNGPESLDWSENRVLDLGGEFAYYATAEKIQQADVGVMTKYMAVMTANVSDLLESGNYKDHCYVEPVEQPSTIWECSLAQATQYLVSISMSNAYTEYLYIKNSESREIPQGVNMLKEHKASFLINSREELLNEIEKVARVIESALKTAFELCETELKHQLAMVSQSMQEVFDQALLREQGYEYALTLGYSDKQFESSFDMWVDAVQGCGVTPNLSLLPDLKNSLKDNDLTSDED
ncbi:hypothetical protein QUN99_003427 [Vibrio parahaemolyticus]|nr:hypothetical protein [Vibrio parahaemolyticus]